jgi:MraZ protein
VCVLLIGSYNHTIDPKGRLFVPAKWREDLGENFIVTRSGSEHCLIGMCIEEWQKLAGKLAALPMTNKDAQKIHRSLSQWATDCELDKQGRILIPQKLRAFAGLEGETTLVGMNNRIEIWNAAELERYNEEEEENYDELLAKAEQWGI